MSDTMQFAKSVLARYPYPLARPASNFNHTSGPEGRFQQLEFLAEMIVRYLGVIAVSNYLRDGLDVVRIQYLLSRLSWPEWDVWLDLLNGISQHYRDRPDEFAIPELIPVYAAPLGQDSDIFKAYQSLVAYGGLSKGVSIEVDRITLDDFLTLLARNHRVGWVEQGSADEADLLHVLFPAFIELLQRLSFLTKYPLGYLIDTEEVDRYRMYVFTGDADTPRQFDVQQMPEDTYLESQQVYLCDINMHPLLGLHPLLVVVDQMLHILYQNENNDHIFYIHCGTREPYEPETPGYSIGEITFAGGSLDWLEPGRIPGDTIIERDIVPVIEVEEHEQKPAIRRVTASELDQQADLSVREILARFYPEEGTDLREDEALEKLETFRARRFEPVDKEIGVPSMHWLEFSTSAYLADLGVAVEDIRVGSILGPYRILAKIGEGPIAGIYKAEHIRSRIPSHQVVLRILKQHIVDQVLHGEVDRGLRSWWLLSQQRYPNILGLTMISKTRGNRFILELERFEGVPLTHLLRKKSSGFSIPEALNIAVQVCRALVAAHKFGLVHGRVKPSNILVDEENNSRVKVTDFGTSEEMASFLLRADGDSLIAMESLSYLPPEHFRDAPIPQESTDIYSVGVLLYHLCTGRPPFQDRSIDECKQRINHGEYMSVPISNIVDNFPLELERLVQRAMQPEPHKRYQRMGILLRDLEAVERSRDAVYAVSQILMDNFSEQVLDSFMSDRRITGPDLKSKVIQYCLLEEALEQVLGTWFGFPQLQELCRSRGLEPSVSSKDEYIVHLLEDAGVHLPPKPEGLRQSIDKVRGWLHRVNSAPTGEEVDGLIVSATRECEAVLKNLIRFHAAFLFHDAWPEILRQEVLGPRRRRLLREGVDKLALGALLEVLDRFNDFVSSSSEAIWFHRVFSSSSILAFPKSWKQDIPSPRNKRVHFDRGMANKTLVELRTIGYRLVKTILDLLELLHRAGTYPQVIVVRESVLDCYRRLCVRCIGDDGNMHTVYTSQDLQPGQQYFFYSQSEPISVDPILIPYEQ